MECLTYWSCSWSLAYWSWGTHGNIFIILKSRCCENLLLWQSDDQLLQHLWEPSSIPPFLLPAHQISIIIINEETPVECTGSFRHWFLEFYDQILCDETLASGMFTEFFARWSYFHFLFASALHCITFQLHTSNLLSTIWQRQYLSRPSLRNVVRNNKQ